MEEIKPEEIKTEEIKTGEIKPEESKRNELWSWLILGGFFWLSGMILWKVNEDEKKRGLLFRKIKMMKSKLNLKSFIDDL